MALPSNTGSNSNRAPAESERPAVVTGKQAVVTGVGDPGNTVVVMVDQLKAAELIVPPSGAWEATLPPLAVGTRSLRAFQIDPSGVHSEPSPPIALLVMESAPLDFTGIGRSAIAAWRKKGSSVDVAFRAMRDTEWQTSRIGGRYPAPGDYDGDGATDHGAVQARGKTLVWRIAPSTTKTEVTIPFGTRGDSILTGCSFDASNRVTLSILDQRKRRISYRELSGESRSSALLLEVRYGNLLGCGDVDGDGVDEVVFEVPSKVDGQARIIGYDLHGKIKLSQRLPRFVRGYLVPRASTDAPFVAVLRSEVSKGLPMNVTTLAGTFAFPLFHVARGSTIAMGLFGELDADQIPGAVWSEPRSGRILSRLFTKDAETTPLFKLPEGYRLLRPQNVFRTMERSQQSRRRSQARRSRR